MDRFPFHTLDTAPADALPILNGARQALGYVPNSFGYLAETPVVLQAYSTLIRLFEQTSLSSTERQVLQLAASVEMGCGFCVALYTSRFRLAGVLGDGRIDALRAGQALDDPRLDALVRFMRAVVAGRGQVDDATFQAFLAAGYLRAQALEVVFAVTVATISSHVNRLAETALNEAFAEEAWTPGAA